MDADGNCKDIELMGSLFSMANTKANQSESSATSPNETYKRQRMSPASVEECPTLIPNIPDELYPFRLLLDFLEFVTTM
ncbi:hypothetical protein JHK87_050255 [Glycine soja]|nr:hypothetical protein JHK87_050255 [Glycine soja]